MVQVSQVVLVSRLVLVLLCAGLFGPAFCASTSFGDSFLAGDKDFQKGDLKSAEFHFLAALKEEAPDSPQYCFVLQRLGNVYFALQKYTDAESILEKTLQLEKKLNWETEVTTANLASVKMKLKKCDEAESVCRDAISNAEKNYGNRSAKLIPLLKNYGDLLDSRFKFAESEKYYAQVLEIAGADKMPSGDALVDAVKDAYAGSLFKQGRYQSAEKILQARLPEIQSKYAKTMPQLVIKSYARLEITKFALGKYDESEALNHEAIDYIKEIIPDDKTDLNYFRTRLLRLYTDQAKFDKAKALIEEIPEEYCRNYDFACRVMASFFEKQGDAKKAETFINRAISLAMADSINGENSPAVAILYSMKASILAKLGNKGEAEKLFCKSIAIDKNVLGEAHPRVEELIRDYAAFLNHEGRKSEAIEQTKLADQISEAIARQNQSAGK